MPEACQPALAHLMLSPCHTSRGFAADPPCSEHGRHGAAALRGWSSRQRRVVPPLVRGTIGMGPCNLSGQRKRERRFRAKWAGANGRKRGGSPRAQFRQSVEPAALLVQHVVAAQKRRDRRAGARSGKAYALAVSLAVADLAAVAGLLLADEGAAGAGLPPDPTRGLALDLERGLGLGRRRSGVAAGAEFGRAAPVAAGLGLGCGVAGVAGRAPGAAAASPREAAPGQGGQGGDGPRRRCHGRAMGCGVGGVATCG